MLTSPSKRKSTRLDALLSWAGIQTKTKTESENVVSEERFRIELQREKSRIDRRSISSEFSVALISGLPRNFVDAYPGMLEKIRQRLRITDCLGWCDDRLGLLLPETGRNGADVVATSFFNIAQQYDLKIGIDILVYPEDDDVVRGSVEFQDFQFSDSDADNRQELHRDPNSSPKEIRFEAIAESVRESFFQSTAPTPFWKRSIDILGASVGLVLLTPVFALSAIAVKLSGPGPIFFHQARDGKDGKPFFVIKFRTMCENAEAMKKSLKEFSEQDGPAFKLENDPRLTTIGKYLRKSCVDELPQLINVLRGDMSLVGPRPLPVGESVECLMWQRKRLEVTPGLTCIWQLKGDRQTKFADWMRMDMEYIRDRSLWLDLKLIFQTIWVAVLHRGSV